MSVNLTIVLPDRPGALADLTEAIAEAGINLEGACGFRARPGESWGVFHMLVEDDEAARAAIEGAGFEIVAEQDVHVEEVENRPGGLAEIIRRLANDGRNIDLIYLARGRRVVIGLDDLKRAQEGVNVMDSSYR